MHTVNFRLLDGLDAKAYQTLRLEALSTSPNNFLSVYEDESKRSTLAYHYDLENAQSGDLFGYYGVFLDDTLVGYVQLGGTFLAKQRHLGYIYNLYIGKEYRRLGLAKQLFAFVIDQIKQKSQIEKLYVTCIASNQSAIQFYQSIGFKVWGTKPGSVKWQGNYEDELKWILELGNFTQKTS